MQFEIDPMIEIFNLEYMRANARERAENMTRRSLIGCSNIWQRSVNKDTLKQEESWDSKHEGNHQTDVFNPTPDLIDHDIICFDCCDNLST